MALKTPGISKPDAAKQMMTTVAQLRNDCVAIKQEIESGNYRRVVTFPAFAIRFNSMVSDLVGRGFSAEVLGPVIVELFEDDPAKTWADDYASDYEDFKLSVQSLTAFIMQNAQAFPYSFNSSGERVYTTDPGSQITGQLNTLLDNVLANFEL